MTNRETIEKANEAFSNGDYEELLTFCTEDIQWTYVGDRTLDGKDKVREYLSAAYKDSIFQIERYVEEGRYIVAIGWVRLSDNEGGVAISPICDIWKFRNGKIAQLMRLFTSFMLDNPHIF